MTLFLKTKLDSCGVYSNLNLRYLTMEFFYKRIIECVVMWTKIRRIGKYKFSTHVIFTKWTKYTYVHNKGQLRITHGVKLERVSVGFYCSDNKKASQVMTQHTGLLNKLLLIILICPHVHYTL